MTTQQTRFQPDSALDAQFDRIQRWALIVAGVGLLVVIIGALFDLGQFMRAYLYAYLFWLGISLGSLAWLLIFHLTGGAWGVAMRRVLEANILVTILMALLFVPLVFGLPLLYPWARPEVRAVDPLLQYKFPYLNVPFFLGRAAGYFVIWIGVALLLTRWSRQQERTSDRDERDAIATRLRQFGGPGVVLYGLAMTFAAFDWTMSLEPHWFSSIYGVMIMAGQMLTAMAFAIVLLAWLTPRSVLGQFMTAQHFNDLGNFLLAATLFWMYIAFCQFLIIWSGNIPEEVVWYLARLEGGWGWVAIFLLLFHFALPFALLLSARFKRNAKRLAAVAVTLLVADLVHLYWLVEPAFHPGDFALNWPALVTPLAIGGIWLFVFLWWFRRRPLLPPHAEAVRELTFAESTSEQTT